MTSLRSRAGHKRSFTPAVLVTIAAASGWLGLSHDTGLAGEAREPSRLTQASVYTAAEEAKQKQTSPAPKVSEEQAKEIALKALPGEVTKVKVEKKRGRTVYVVEIQTPNEGEKDVWVHMETGKVLLID